VRTDRYHHISKALLPPPAKWHGLQDVEKRYRERYIDLFANPAVAQVFRARGLIIQALRSYLDDYGFLEVETPVLQRLHGGASARPFKTHHNALDLPLSLRIAPELYLKRLLVGGFDRVYELGRTFRNEGISTRHNPEFTILEFYMAYATYEDLMDLAEKLLRTVDKSLRERHPDMASDRPFDLNETWPRVTMRQSIIERLQEARRLELSPSPFDDVLDLTAVYNPNKLEEACAAALPSLPPDTQKHLAKCQTNGHRLFFLFEHLVEPDLTKLYRTPNGMRSAPVFITEYPAEVSPLARRNDEQPDFVDRFELFIEGKEIANAFSELNDPDDQAERFRLQLEQREAGDDEAMVYDEDYVRALLHGMPPAAGFGLGVDRLVMLLCNQSSIRDVLLFPLMRPET